MGLDIGVVSPKEGLCPVTGQIFHHVHALTAAIVTLARIALGVLVGENGGSSGQGGLADEVLRGDQLQISSLAAALCLLLFLCKI